MPVQIPVVVFAYNRPEKLKRVLAALKHQNIDRLMIFVDGPRREADTKGVQACREIAGRVDWVETQLFTRESNFGLSYLYRNMEKVFQCCQQAVFVEDDCLPMPSFYAFMRQALERYRTDPRVFSIGGYQAIEKAYFKDYRFNLVSTARFTCWGWGTWSDRWQEIAALLEGVDQLFDQLQAVPDLAGVDIPMAAHLGAGNLSWDLRVALATLAGRKVHLLATRGLVRNIGQDLSGVHKGRVSSLASAIMHNRNLVSAMPSDLDWLQDSGLNCAYNARLCDFVHRVRQANLKKLVQRARIVGRRHGWPRPERYPDLDLIGHQPGNPSKRALLSYIVHPFSISPYDRRFYNHINIWRAQEIVRVLNRMGFRVDAIDYRDADFKVAKEYDLFIGHGGLNFAQIARQLPEKTPKIYFSTGSYWKTHNQEEERRREALFQRQGVHLPLDRYIQPGEEEALRMADGILGIGNATTHQTYAGFSRVQMVNGTALPDASFDWCPKDYDRGRQHFAFFSGGGNLHKGLDLVLEAFTGLQQHLWIGTRLDTDFLKFYRGSIYGQDNIHTLGWVQPRSERFYHMMQTCTFCLLPSASEGQSQAVIECMNQGLIPLVTPQSGVDVEAFGVYLSEPTPQTIRALVQQVSRLNPQECQQRSQLARHAATNQYSQTRFSADFRAALEVLLA